jgi:phage-related protein
MLRFMARLQAVFYRDSDGLEPVNYFIDGLDPKAQEALDWQISLLNALDDDDPPLAFPHSSQVDGELRELRCHHGRRLFRILYRRSEKLFVLLHAFEKRTAKVPVGEIAIAQRRWDDFKTRMAERPRRRPRAAGHDAPKSDGLISGTVSSPCRALLELPFRRQASVVRREVTSIARSRTAWRRTGRWLDR